MKRILACVLAVVMVFALAACGAPAAEDSSSPSASAGSSSSPSASASDFDSTREISVVSREDGSGTRGAFIELFGIEEKGEDGTKTDKTTKEAAIANRTDVMLTNIAGNEYAIGYVSLGSLNETVKALKIDGAEATAENVKNGTYKVSRPFNIATKGEPTSLAKDFINFILSKEGQEVVSGDYIAVNDNAEAFKSDNSTGKIVIAGSSSVSPVMEKLVEAYKAINTGAEIEIQTNDSTAGMIAAMDGTCDIGMASRELKDSELAELTPTQIAIDGIAVIVNNANPLEELDNAAVKSIYTGEATTWDQIIK